MNREKLVKARRRVIIQVIKAFKAYQKWGETQTFLAQLKDLMEDMNFPSLYEELITYLADA